MKRIFSLTAAAVFALSTAWAHPAGEPQTQNETAMTTHTLTSKYGFEETISRLETAIKSKGMNIFAVIDHQEAARHDGLTMQPAKVIVFGTPKAGTPLMVKDPAFALQLPLRVLVTETDGKVRAVYTDTHALIAGSRISFDEVANTLANAEKLIQKTVGE